MLNRLERVYANQKNFAATTAMVLSNEFENQGEKIKVIAISFFGNNRQFGNRSGASMSEVMFSFMKQAVQKMEKS